MKTMFNVLQFHHERLQLANTFHHLYAYSEAKGARTEDPGESAASKGKALEDFCYTHGNHSALFSSYITMPQHRHLSLPDEYWRLVLTLLGAVCVLEGKSGSCRFVF